MPASRWLLRVSLLVVLGALLLPGVAVAQAAPGIPTSVAVTAGDGIADVSWVAPDDDGGATISGYTVTTSPGGVAASVPGVARTARVTGLSNGVTYRFTVTASNRVGQGPPSAVSNAVTPAPAVVTAPGPELIREEFSAPPANVLAVAGGTWGVASGRYVLSAPADGGEAVANANLAVHTTVVTGDFVLRVSAGTTPSDSAFNDFSVVFGYRDPADYWFASFSESNDGNISGIFRVAGGARTELADITAPIVAGTLYPIRIERQGAAIRVFRSEEQVASVSDPTLVDGRVGFGSRNDGATFDDLVVTALVPPPPPAPDPPKGFFTRMWQRLISLFSD